MYLKCYYSSLRTGHNEALDDLKQYKSIKANKSWILSCQRKEQKSIAQVYWWNTHRQSESQSYWSDYCGGTWELNGLGKSLSTAPLIDGIAISWAWPAIWLDGLTSYDSKYTRGAQMFMQLDSIFHLMIRRIAVFNEYSQVGFLSLCVCVCASVWTNSVC